LGGRWNGSRGMARCPCHDDSKPSLSIRDGDETGRLIVTCFATCDRSDIIAELRRMGVLGDERRSGASSWSTRQRAEPDHKPDEIALAMWKGVQVAQPESIVSRYLKSRGIDAIPPTI